MKMKDAGMSKPKKHANMVGKLTCRTQNHFHITLSTHTAIKQNTKSCTADLPWKLNLK